MLRRYAPSSSIQSSSCAAPRRATASSGVRDRKSSPEKINVFEIFKLYMPEDANDISKRVRVV